MTAREDAVWRARYMMQTRGGELRDWLKHDAGDLDQIAAALGGEVNGSRVLAPSPGRAASDRSMVVCVDPARPADFYVYACDGPPAAAKAMVAEKLRLILPAPQPAEERTAAAMRIWAETIPAAGTLVETYLRSRGIDLAPTPVIRFHPRLWHGPSGSAWPAMVALVTDVDDVPVAIHRTYLRSDGMGKALIDPDKMVLGPIGGCAIRLAAATDEIVVGEGIETCLSVLQATGRPTWSALSCNGLKALVLPPAVRKVTVAADRGEEGEKAALYAEGRWSSERREARIIRPRPEYEDFNDQLMERVKP